MVRNVSKYYIKDQNSCVRLIFSPEATSIEETSHKDTAHVIDLHNNLIMFWIIDFDSRKKYYEEMHIHESRIRDNIHKTCNGRVKKALNSNEEKKMNSTEINITFDN
jgi:hypothetical protein